MPSITRCWASSKRPAPGCPPTGRSVCRGGDGCGTGVLLGPRRAQLRAGTARARAPTLELLRFQERMAALPMTLRCLAPSGRRRGQRALCRWRICPLPGGRRPPGLDGRVLRERRHPPRAVGRGNGHELPLAPGGRDQRGRRLDAHGPNGFGRRGRSAWPGQPALRTRGTPRASAGAGDADLGLPAPGGRADQAGAPREHRCPRPGCRHGAGEPEPGAGARDARSPRPGAPRGIVDAAPGRRRLAASDRVHRGGRTSG